MLGQRPMWLTGIEPAMGCDAGPILNRYCVGRLTLCVPRTLFWRVHWPAMVVEGIGIPQRRLEAVIKKKSKSKQTHVRSMLKMRLTGTRLHKFLLNTCRTSRLVIVRWIQVFSECSGVKEGMLLVILAPKNLYLPLESIFFENLKLAIFSYVLCFFFLFGIANPKWGCPGLPTLLLWTQFDELWPI